MSLDGFEWNRGTGVATWKEYRKAVVKRQASRMIKAGSVVREARSAKRDPVVEGMYKGRNVIVLGIAADEKWYEHEGAIGAVNSQLKSYGLNVRHRPLKEIISH